MKDVLFVAPHSDDESLGCGGTILRHRDAGDRIHWLLVTVSHVDYGFSAERIAEREKEIDRVAAHFRFDTTTRLNFPATMIDSMPLGQLVAAVSKVFRQINPNVVYLPYRGDVHSDHTVTFDAVAACTKWFRYPSVERVLCYEAISETEFGINPDINGFRPNVFVDISAHLETKMMILREYRGELGEFPFPRSEQAVRALAAYRGATAGVAAAEAFMLLRERM
ncbi:MAG TPA: PIG-L family deacetylase [Thermoanaerobaculia bacterium]|nr:PIG-L family deacetylase [Thermoanaerobaculia bacterium]